MRNDVTPAQLIQAFCRYERRLSGGVMAVGIASIAAGWWGSRALEEFSAITGISVAVLGIPFLVLGVRWYRRAGRIRTILQAEPDEKFLVTYTADLEGINTRIRRTRNIGAIWLGISIVCLIATCVLDMHSNLIILWLALCVQTCLISVIAYYRVFESELHLHELRNSMSG